MNHVTDERKRNVSKRVPIGLACYADLASSEATVTTIEVSRGCIKMGKGERREEKKFLRPFLKRKEVRVGFWSSSSFVVPGNSCSVHVRKVWPRPSAAMSIGKRSLFMHTPSLPSTYAFLLYPISSLGRPALVHTVSNVYQNIAIVIVGSILCPSNCKKMHIMASDFSKISRGSIACPRTP